VIRVYLISGQNLTATGTVIDWKSRLAGMTALSSASPYPVITVGDGETKDKLVKQVHDREGAFENDLNPKFF